ncbi:hypothetical protein FYJ43_08605 [Cutibacterium sp. WCA-380-WT-3A]|uniref:Uncharacterized protein n=2 Tax=Cutibacterium porci TaxID=2605781 RepID=A0A7K0J8C6_9ACTN|nr:hypothetical protein [Cutibacterium porci]
MSGTTKCVADQNVWVYVEQRDGTSKGACASRFGTGLEALESAGFVAKTDGGMVTMIDGYPTKVDTTQAYWSYWHATPNGDKPAKWESSQTGAEQAHPKAGSIEGWYFKALTDDWQAAPSWTYDPSAITTPSPSATPTQTPKPTVTPTGSATPAPSATAPVSAIATAPATALNPVAPVAVGPYNRPSGRPAALPHTGV